MKRIAALAATLTLVLGIAAPAGAQESTEREPSTQGVVCSIFAGTPTVAGGVVKGFGAISCSGGTTFVRVYVQLSKNNALIGGYSTGSGITYASAQAVSIDSTLARDGWHTWVWGFALKNGKLVWEQGKPGKRSTACKYYSHLPLGGGGLFAGGGIGVIDLPTIPCGRTVAPNMRVRAF